MQNRYASGRLGRAAVTLGAVLMLFGHPEVKAQSGHPSGMRGGALVPSAYTLPRGALALGMHGTVGREGTLNTVLALGSVAYGLSHYVELYASRSTFFTGSGAGLFEYAGFQQGDAVGPVGIVLRLPRAPERAMQFAFTGSVTPGINNRALSGHNHPYARDSFDIYVGMMQSLRKGKFDFRFVQGFVITEDTPVNVPSHGTLGLGLTFRAAPWLGLDGEILSRLEGEAPVNITQDYLGASVGAALHLTDWLDLRGGYLLGLSIDRADGIGTRSEKWAAYGGFQITLWGPRTPRPVRPEPEPEPEPEQPERPVQPPVQQPPPVMQPGDADGDGVADAIDLEPDTPLGAIVDAQGRALDGDADGVPDGLDQEPETPAGAVVDTAGRAIDTDGDGVFDGLDMEMNTPAGALVNAMGVALDGDGDGVPDGIDVEPQTPQGVPVNALGRGLVGMEAELITRGLLTLNTVYFDYNSARIKPESYGTLREVGLILEKYDELKIEIGGHSDSVGSVEYNRALSLARAQSVLDWLLGNVPTLRLDQFTVYGYGPAQPVAGNDTDEGRRLNRRVEFKVLNVSALQKYRPSEPPPH